MESLLLNLMYFFRPIMSMYVDITVFGLGFADLATMFFTLCLIVLAIISSSASSRAQSISVTEKWMLLFILWATVVSLYQYEVVDFKTYVKGMLPLVTYMVMKRAISDKQQYTRLLMFMVAGFSVPVLISAFKTMRGLGLHTEIYWTGLQRYHGAYARVHDLAHNMALLIIVLTILYFITNGGIVKQGKKIKFTRLFIVICLTLMALYNMYSAQVRTVYIGIVLFGMIVLFLRSKKGLVVYIAAGVFAVAIFSSTIYTIFFDVIDAVEGKRSSASAGSGRFDIWSHNWDVYSGLPVPDKILGLGIGNKLGTADPVRSGQELVYDSHNDWLTVFMATGPLGLILMLGVYWSLYARIRQLSGGEKAVYLAFFITVVVMNMASNSYINRFPLAQTFYMLMVYLELNVVHKAANNTVRHNRNNPRILSMKKENK